MSVPTMTDSGATVLGTVTCVNCGRALHLACPNCGPGADYEVTPRKVRRSPAEVAAARTPPHPGFSSKPCTKCGRPVELTGKGRPHFRCVACRG